MVFNISLTTESDTADTAAAEFVDILSARGFTAEEKERRSNYGSKVYILYTITPGSISGRNKGGRPAKLSPEQLAEVREKLNDSSCNKSALAREYGVSYQTIHKIAVQSKTNYN